MKALKDEEPKIAKAAHDAITQLVSGRHALN